MNEAIEIAKRFGDEQSSSFINGVLSNIKDNLGYNFVFVLGELQ